ncbi:MAG TPA: sigma-70 family RNA polymerase sigma factor [Trebonia sp.]
MEPLVEKSTPPAAPPDPAGPVAALYEAHALGLLRLAVIMLGDQQAAEDVVQDAFLGLYRRWHALRSTDRAQAYVRSAVFNGCRSVLRQRARHRQFVLAGPDSESVEAGVLLSEEHEAVLAALRRLPDRQREAVALRYCLDMPPGEVATAMGISLVAVRGTETEGAARPGGNAAPPSAAGTPPAAAQVPRYYIAASLPAKAIIGDVRTGKQVATITPPAGHSIAGVAGAADGSAFVLDMPQKKPGDFAAGQFFMYRPATPGGPPVRRSVLNLKPSPAGEAILGVALSPDGSRLAVYSMLSYEQVLRVYSVATGRVANQWTMPSPSHVGYGPDDNSHMLTWTENGQAVAFRRDINLAGGEFGVSDRLSVLTG